MNINNSQNGKPIFGEYTTFDIAFPYIKTINVIFTETGRNTNPLSPSIFGKDNFRENISCSNGACISGGFHLGSIIRDMR